MGSNAKPRSASKVALESFDDLFGGNTAQENGIEQIINAPLAELYTFKDHPFRVEDDEKMEETTESIRQYGVLVPGIARPRAGGGYEIIAGHRRKRGLKKQGLTRCPSLSGTIRMMKLRLSWWIPISRGRTSCQAKRREPIR